MTRRLSNWKTSIALAALFFAAASPATPAVETTPLPEGGPPTETEGWAIVHVPLFMESRGYHSVLTLNNNRPEPMRVEVEIFGPEGGKGGEQPLPIEIPGLAAVEFPLETLSPESPPFGSLQIRYRGVLHEVAAQVTVSSRTRRVSFESVETHGGVSSTLHSILWLPSPASKATIALTNLSDHLVTARFGVAGRESPQEVRLKARETRLIDPANFMSGDSGDHAPALLAIKHDGQPGEMSASGFVVDLKSGFSSTLTFSDPALANSSRLAAADFKLGPSEPGRGARPLFHADLALANRGDSSQKARIFVNYTLNGLSSRIEAARLELDPSEARVIDLARRLLELGVAGPGQEAGLDILYDGPAGSLIGRLSSHDSSGDQAFDTPVKDPEATAPSGGSYPWRLDGERRTVVHLKNTTDGSEKAFVQVRWSGGFYTPAPITLGPWESTSIDLERVRGSAVPDLVGAFLPPEATSGQFVWYSETQGVLIGRAEVRTDGLGLASSFSCPSTCCGLVRDSDYMDPGSLTDVVGNEGDPFIAEETRRDCYGIVFGPYDMSDESQWASSDSSVASVSGSGHVTCLSAGSTGITASFDSIVAFTTYPTVCFAVVAGGVAGATLLVGDPTVTITAPPDNPTPSDSGFSTNFSFLSNTQVGAQAVLSEAGDTSQIQWSVSAQSGGVTNEQPSTRSGPSYSFKPNPPAHPSYLAGTGCSNPGNGSCARSTALSFAIQAAFFTRSDTNTITQDQKDIIRQEYLNHGLTIATRSELHSPQATTNFTVSEILAFTSYSVILGQPATLAQAVRDEYNKRIHDDVQVQAVGAIGLASNAVVVSPGQTVQTIGAILDTQACRNAPNPATCDDQVMDDNIVAGPNGIAETEAYNGTTSFGLVLSSAWRNPQRNEAVGGKIGSRHQFGDAVDLQVGTVPGKTTLQLYCILETASDAVAGANGFTEQGGTQVDCDSGSVDHVHVQK